MSEPIKPPATPIDAPTAAPAKKAATAPKPVAPAANPRRRLSSKAFRREELETLGDYLRRPISVGYWRLSVIRRLDGKFIRHFAEHKKLDFGAFRLEATKPSTGIRVNEESEIAVASKLTTFLSAVNSAHLVSEGHDLKSLLAKDDHGIRSSEFFDPAVILEKFPETIKIFKEKITYADYSSLISKGDRYEISSGSVILISGWESNDATFVSLSKEPLVAFTALLEAAEIIRKPVVERVFSPEEELLSPYFELLKLGYAQTIGDQRLFPQLQTAFVQFEKEDFSHTIGSLGIIAEDYLTQIYEYYFRAPCPRGSTLGQIYDQIHQRIRELIAPKPLELSELEPIYKSLTELKKPSEGKESKPEDLIPIIREVLGTIKSDRRFFLERIESSTKQSRRLSIFPESIHENLMELIRNRNAAAHKTRIPLGRFEALRTLYCLTAFIIWWREEKAQINWELGAVEIVKAAVARH